ncbi:bifunctional DNA primase/polymerase [Promicromonospora sp. NFX87]|uniref:bifunctional DNA primase/polymerase n=1 Tax=Promicromonospora sp. NFX87 TaxID=3402691 RepID=UPI003AFA61D5
MDTTHELDPAPLTAARRAAATSSTGEAARVLAAAGVPVFPCIQGSTRPLTVRGLHSASTDLDRVAWWWSRYPTTNLAVPTGSASRLDVLEVRTDRTLSGISALQSVMRAGLLPRPGLAISTPTGGLSLIFPRSPQTTQPSWDAPRSGLRFHGDGGHVLLPPSVVLRADGVVAHSQLVGPGSDRTGPVDADLLRRLVAPDPMRHGQPALAPDVATRSGQRSGHAAGPRPVTPAGAKSMLRPDPGGSSRRPPEVVSL